MPPLLEASPTRSPRPPLCHPCALCCRVWTPVEKYVQQWVRLQSGITCMTSAHTRLWENGWVALENAESWLLSKQSPSQSPWEGHGDVEVPGECRKGNVTPISERGQKSSLGNHRRAVRSVLLNGASSGDLSGSLRKNKVAKNDQPIMQSRVNHTSPG